MSGGHVTSLAGTQVFLMHQLQLEQGLQPYSFRKPSHCTAKKGRNAALQSVLSDSKQSAGQTAMQIDLHIAYYHACSMQASCHKVLTLD